MKRIAELRDLSDDHHVALVLARRCRQSASLDAPIPADVAWRQVLAAFPNHLEPHFAIEERHLLPALETIGESGLADRVRRDHTVLRALAGLGSPNGAGIEQFGRLLESHIRFEEREVFEIAQSRLTPAMLRAIAEACQSTPRACPAFLKG